MKKFILSLLFGAAMMPAFADENTTTTFGYCNDDVIWQADGLSIEVDANVGVAIRIPKEELVTYKAGRIIGFEFGAADGCKDHEIRAFLRKGSLKSENVASTTDYVSFTRGVTPVLFDQGWTIPEDLDEDVYVGLYTFNPAHKNIIGISSTRQQVRDENSIFLADSDDLTVTEPSNWDDITLFPLATNNVVLRAIIELPSDNYTDVLRVVDAYMPNICQVGKPTNVYLFLKNAGTTEVSSFTVNFACGEQSQSIPVSIQGEPMPIGYETGTREALAIPVEVYGTGKHVLSITKVNGNDNAATEQYRSYEFDLIGVPEEEANKHTRRPLYEFYCSETDYTSGVREKDYIAPVIDAFEGRCVYLPQHTNDKFAQNPVDVPVIVDGEQSTVELSDADLWAIKLYSYSDITNIKTSVVCVDRTLKMHVLREGGNTLMENVFDSGFPYPVTSESWLSEALETPTFASVEVENAFDAETRVATIKVSGTIADLLPEGEQATLSVYIVEESVWSDSQEFPDNESTAERFPDGMFDHKRVIRETVTSFWGDELKPGEDFVKTYVKELDNPIWNADHMKVVAVIQRPQTNHYLKLDVLNSTEEPLTDTYNTDSSISSVESSVNAGDVIYDLQGRRLSNAVRGVNIINGKKVLVK